MPRYVDVPVVEWKPYSFSGGTGANQMMVVSSRSFVTHTVYGSAVWRTEGRIRGSGSSMASIGEQKTIMDQPVSVGNYTGWYDSKSHGRVIQTGPLPADRNNPQTSVSSQTHVLFTPSAQFQHLYVDARRIDAEIPKLPAKVEEPKAKKGWVGNFLRRK